MAKPTTVIKRDGTEVPYDENKILEAIRKAFFRCGFNFVPESVRTYALFLVENLKSNHVEDIQDAVQTAIMANNYYTVAVEYIKYREKHKELRFVEERLKYMEKYSVSKVNAASSSETDDNSNVSQKNVANLEGEVYKTTNRIIQRRRMKKKLLEMFPEVADMYEKDLDNHIIYVHDEASSPTLKPYCMACSLYPLLEEGSGNVDGITPTPPNDIQSFSGQVTNLVFLLSSQVKGAVALGEYIIALNYYVVKEFGEDWYMKLDDSYTSGVALHRRSVRDVILKGMKQFIYGVNQPAGNRSYNSPFTNISYYDEVYFNALFGNFKYPDGTKPEWHQIDVLQRMFCKLHRELRMIKPLTFPVTTFCMVHDGEKCIDESFKKWSCEEYAKGTSAFTFLSDSPTSLASCCRVLNKLTFSSTTGGLGIMTGSCNVITLNLNRILQDYFIDFIPIEQPGNITSRLENSRKYFRENYSEFYENFCKYLSSILERVYKYQIAYKTMLYEQEDAGMYSSSNAGYIRLSKLYCTIGVIGYFEAAKFLGIETSYNDVYIKFLQKIFYTIREENEKHSISTGSKPFVFNTEAVPGESLAVKLYNWDKSDGYVVPSDQNLYNCYFFSPWDDTDILTKMKLHGKDVAPYLGGGQAAHLNLCSHLSSEQYSKLVDDAIRFGTNYYTYNIPVTECAECGHVVNAPVEECPKCHSKKLKYWTRIIGYMTCVNNWSTERAKEFHKRFFGDKTI